MFFRKKEPVAAPSAPAAESSSAGSTMSVSMTVNNKTVAATIDPRTLLVHFLRDNQRLTLAVAFNYGGRRDIVDAVRALVAQGLPLDAIDEQQIGEHLSTRGMPDPDLIIRTSGEWRLSNFLIWQAAYSEYWTTPMFWPDFGPEQLRQAIHDYGQRERRFGGLSNE